MKFSILITTKNRLNDLIYTLQNIEYLLENDAVECMIYDDGSIDDTSNYITKHYPQVRLKTNKISKGYLYCRNKMLNDTNADFAISIDDDAHFITSNPLEKITNYFAKNPKVGLLGFRIFWSKEEPKTKNTNQVPHQMKSFVGCAHVWRMAAWRAIPDYPEWFVFYGEEDFAAYQLFKNKWEVHYLPQVLTHHRVDLIARKKDADYYVRQRRSLRSGWYLYFLFLPLGMIPKKMAYSIWMQLKLKVFRGDWQVLKVIILALFDLIFALPKIIKNSNRLSKAEFKNYTKLANTKLYWKPEND